MAKSVGRRVAEVSLLREQALIPPVWQFSLCLLPLSSLGLRRDAWRSRSHLMTMKLQANVNT